MSAVNRARLQAADPARLADQLLNDAAIGLSAVDKSLVFTLVNRALAEAVGHTPADMIGTSIFDYVHIDDLKALAESAAQLRDAPPGVVAIPTPFRAKHADGHQVVTEVWLQSIDRSGSPYHMVFAHRSGEPTAAIDRYLQSTVSGDGLDVSFTALADSLECTFPCDVLFYWGWDGQGFAHVVGHRSELIEQHVMRDFTRNASDPLEPSKCFPTAVQLAGQTGQPIDHIDFDGYPPALRAYVQLHAVTACQVMPMRHLNDLACMVMWNRQQPASAGQVMAPGIASRLLLERTSRLGTLALQRWSTDQRIAQEMRTDPLTQVMNRFGLMEVLTTAENKRQTAWVFIIDIDGFKLINDEHGHPVGDFVLAELARRFCSVVPRDAIVARLGGDEFAVYLGNDGREANYRMHIMEALRESVVDPVTYEDMLLRIDISIGAGSIGISSNAKSALAAADKDMYAEKTLRRRQGSDLSHTYGVSHFVLPGDINESSN
jgi:diguanylate cyclase (GGDEF)-like protein/PAS domain S-box-containing protein